MLTGYPTLRLCLLILLLILSLEKSPFDLSTNRMVSAQALQSQNQTTLMSSMMESFEAKMNAYNGQIYFLLSDSKRELSKVASCAIKVWISIYCCPVFRFPFCSLLLSLSLSLSSSLLCNRQHHCLIQKHPSHFFRLELCHCHQISKY